LGDQIQLGWSAKTVFSAIKKNKAKTKLSLNPRCKNFIEKPLKDSFV
jgi:hypothetical protein